MPNPGRGGCVLRYSLAEAQPGSLAVYDAGGRRVRTLESGTLARGAHVPRWDGLDDAGRPSPEGIYFARLRLGHATQARRLTLLR